MLKELRTLRHRLLSLEHNLMCAGIECFELRSLDVKLAAKIAEKAKSTDFDFRLKEED